MANLNVGGLNPFNKYKNFVEVLDAADPDDTIKLHKRQSIASVIDKHLIIDGGGKEIFVEPSRAGFIFEVPAIVKNVKFVVSSRSNALVLKKGGILENVEITFTSPAHELYPAVVHESGKLTIIDSNLQKLAAS